MTMSDSVWAMRALIDAYRRADYYTRLPNGARAQLHIGMPVTTALSTRLADNEIGGFITAWNPNSVSVAREQNRRRQRELLRALHGVARDVRVGVGRGLHWREPSFCVLGIELAMLDRLARQFGQNAVLTFQRGDLVRLRVYRGEWHPYVDDDDVKFAPPPAPGTAIR